jgi:hypothetical protein
MAYDSITDAERAEPPQVIAKGEAHIGVTLPASTKGPAACGSVGRQDLQ